MSENDDSIGKTVPRTGATSPEHPRVEVATLPPETPGRYALPENLTDPELGRGGMGRVLLLRDQVLQREVAIKELLSEHRHPMSSNGPALDAQFVREARVLARLDHPGVLPIFELGRRDDGTPFYAMRRLHGRNLSNALTDAVRLDERLTLLPHFIDVVGTIAYAHKRGIIHRDLKPENVMIGPYGETIVLDWGLAHVDGEPDLVEPAAGTPAYMSPEQIRDDTVDQRSDVWALGVMLFELVTGQLPFDQPTPTAVFLAVTQGPIPDPSTIEPKAPRALLDIIRRAMSRAPEARYADAGAMLEALQKASLVEAPRAPVVPWLVAALCALLAGGAYLSGSSATERAIAQGENADRTSRLNAARLTTNAALLELEAGNVGRALALAQTVSQSPLARGIAMVAADRGVPSVAWKATSKAGCSRLIAVDGLAVCATLNGVEAVELDSGTPVSFSPTAPILGWQHSAAVVSAQVFATAGDDRVVHLWSTQTHRELERVGPTEAGIVTMSAAGAGRLLIGLRSGEVLSLTVTQSAEKKTFAPVAHGGPSLRSLAAASERDFALNDGFVTTVHRAAGKPFRVQARGSTLAFDATGQRVFIGAETAVIVSSLNGTTSLAAPHPSGVTALAAGTRLITGDARGVVRWWSTDTFEHLGSFSEFGAPVQALAMVPESADVLVAPRSAFFARVHVPTAPGAYSDEGSPVVHAFFSDGALYSGTLDGRVRRVDANTGQVLWLDMHHDGALQKIVELPGPHAANNGRLLTASTDKHVRLLRWNGEVEVIDTTGVVSAVAASTDGALAAWALSDGTLVVWNLKLGKEVSREQVGLVHALAFSPSGRWLAAAREDRRISVFKAESGKESFSSDTSDGAVLSIGWRTDDIVAWSNARGVVGLLPMNGTPKQTTLEVALSAPNAPPPSLESLSTAPNGARLAVASGNRLFIVDAELVLLAELPLRGSVVAHHFRTNDSIAVVAGERRVQVFSITP